MTAGVDERLIKVVALVIVAFVCVFVRLSVSLYVCLHLCLGRGADRTGLFLIVCRCV